jgi:hypothetical protein
MASENGKVEYFIEQTNDRLEKIDQKLDEMIKFKWQIIGGSVVLSLVVTVIVQLSVYVVNKGV